MKTILPFILLLATGIDIKADSIKYYLFNNLAQYDGYITKSGNVVNKHGVITGSKIDQFILDISDNHKYITVKRQVYNMKGVHVQSMYTGE